MNRLICKSRGFGFMSCLFIFFIVLALFGILWIRSNVIAIEYKLSQLEEKKKSLLREQKMLLAQKSSLTSIARLEKGEVISLNFPDRKKVVYITEKSVSVSKISYKHRD